MPGPDAVEQLGASDERYPEAGREQQHAAAPRIALHVMDAALDRTDGNRIGDQIGFKAGLDDEQSAKFLQADHGKPNAMKVAPFRPFPIKDSG